MLTGGQGLVARLAQHREVAQVAAVVPGGTGPVQRHLPHEDHTGSHDLIHVCLHSQVAADEA